MKSLLAIFSILVCLNVFADEPSTPPGDARTGEVDGCPNNCVCMWDGSLSDKKSQADVDAFCNSAEGKLPENIAKCTRPDGKGGGTKKQ